MMRLMAALADKPWEFALVPHDEVRLNSSFNYLMRNRVSDAQMVMKELLELLLALLVNEVAPFIQFFFLSSNGINTP